MDLSTLQRKLKELAGSSLPKALDQLTEALSDRSQTFNELILLKSRYAKGEANFRNNFISEEEYSILHSRLTDKLLTLIDELGSGDLEADSDRSPNPEFLEPGTGIYALNCLDYLELLAEEIKRAKTPFRDQYLMLAQFFEQFGEMFVQAGSLFEGIQFPAEEQAYREAIDHFQALASKNCRRFQIFNFQMNNRLPELRSANENLIAAYRKVVYYLDLPQPSMREAACLDKLKAIGSDLKDLAQKTLSFQSTFLAFEEARTWNDRVSHLIAQARSDQAADNRQLEPIFAAEDQLIEAIRSTLQLVETIRVEAGNWAGQFKAMASEIGVSILELEQGP